MNDQNSFSDIEVIALWEHENVSVSNAAAIS